MIELLGGLESGELFWPLLACFPRIAGFLLAFPLFGREQQATLVTQGVVLSIALFAYPIVAADFPDPRPSAVEWLALAPKEFGIGFALGFALGVAIWAVESAGDLVDTQSGLNNASTMDPGSSSPASPTGKLARHGAIALVATSGLLLQFVVLLVQSFRAWPWQRFLPDPARLAEAALQWRAEQYWHWTLAFAAPAMLALLLLELGLGLVNRATPHFDVYSLGMPLKSLAAAACVVLVASVWSEALLQLYREDVARLLGWMAVPAR